MPAEPISEAVVEHELISVILFFRKREKPRYLIRDMIHLKDWLGWRGKGLTLLLAPEEKKCQGSMPHFVSNFRMIGLIDILTNGGSESHKAIKFNQIASFGECRNCLIRVMDADKRVWRRKR